MYVSVVVCGALLRRRHFEYRHMQLSYFEQSNGAIKLERDRDFENFSLKRRGIGFNFQTILVFFAPGSDMQTIISEYVYIMRFMFTSIRKMRKNFRRVKFVLLLPYTRVIVLFYVQ